MLCGMLYAASLTDLCIWVCMLQLCYGKSVGKKKKKKNLLSGKIVKIQ